MCCPRGRDAAVPLMERQPLTSRGVERAYRQRVECRKRRDYERDLCISDTLRSRDDPCKFCNFCSFPFVFTVSVSCLSI